MSCGRKPILIEQTVHAQGQRPKWSQPDLAWTVPQASLAFESTCSAADLLVPVSRN